MADVNGRGLVILNSQRRLFRLQSRIFEPDSYFSNVNVGAESFFLDDSLMGMAVTTPDPERREYSSELYLRSFASRSLYAASCDVLDRSTFGDAVKYKGVETMTPSQATAMAFSKDGTLFFGLTREIAIGCWNRFQEMNRDNVVSGFWNLFSF